MEKDVQVPVMMNKIIQPVFICGKNTYQGVSHE